MLFSASEQLKQSAFFDSEGHGRNGFEGAAYRLAPADREYNLAPGVRTRAQNYMTDKGIVWHRHASHGLSSQVCCFNFLMPLATRPSLLAKVVQAALGIAQVEMLEVEKGPNSEPWFIGFEWNGHADYLNEAKNGIRTRGANSTSADAFVRFRYQGRTEALRIEWKYTETYSSPISKSGNEERRRRYSQIAFAPRGPIRNDLGISLDDFFFEPFYQLLRQQMLAYQMELAKEDKAERVRVLHIAPRGNTALRKVTSKNFKSLGLDAFAVFGLLLVDPSAFLSKSTEDIFGPLVLDHLGDDGWADYLDRRYLFLKG